MIKRPCRNKPNSLATAQKVVALDEPTLGQDICGEQAPVVSNVDPAPLGGTDEQKSFDNSPYAETTRLLTEPSFVDESSRSWIGGS